MKVLQVILESGDGNTLTMLNPIFKVKYPDSSEVIYDLNITGIEFGKGKRTMILRPTTIKKDINI